MQSIRVFIALAVVISQLVSPSRASAVGSTTVVISEVMTGAVSNASQEFVELYNRHTEPISVDGWVIEYKSASSSDLSSSWSRKAQLSGSIEPHGFYLVAPKIYYPSANAEWVSAMAGTAGHVRIKDNSGVIIDTLGYGVAANSPELTSALAPDPGMSIERLPGAKNESAGNGIDTNDNGSDFLKPSRPQPQSSQDDREIFDPDIPLPPVTEVPGQSPEYLGVEITELLINPASPLTDAEDEFIELFNPNQAEVNLSGYQLKGGTDFKDSYTFGQTLIKPGEYLSFRSTQTSLGLTNTGGAVRLFDPDGNLLDETATYSEAADGLVWAKFQDVWQWSSVSTPGAPNIISSPLDPAAVAAKAKALAKIKKPTSKAAPKAKVAKAKKTTIKKPKAAKKKTGPKVVQVAGAQLRPATWLIIGLVLLTIGYAIYEFRHDIRNLYFRFRSYIYTRGSHR